LGPITARISCSRTEKLTSFTASLAETHAQQAVWQNDYQRDQDRRENEKLVPTGLEQQIPPEVQNKGAEDRAEDIAEAAQETVQHEVDGIDDGEAGGIDRLRDRHEDRPADTAQERRDGVGDDAQVGDVDPDRRGQLLVLLKRATELSEARIDQPVECGKRENHQDDG
jgi:hypothetical protein